MDRLERVPVFQGFHHGHHCVGRLGHSSGNFENLFSMFDWLHDTGRQPHAVREKIRVAGSRPHLVDQRVPTEEAVRYASRELAAASAVIITANHQAAPVSLT